MLEGTSVSHVLQPGTQSRVHFEVRQRCSRFHPVWSCKPIWPHGIIKAFIKCLLNKIMFPHYTLMKCSLIAPFPLHQPKVKEKPLYSS